MRTTLTIDDETDSSLRRISRKQGITYKDVVNRALEEGLKALEARAAQEGILLTEELLDQCMPYNADRTGAKVLRFGERSALSHHPSAYGEIVHCASYRLGRPVFLEIDRVQIKDPHRCHGPDVLYALSDGRDIREPETGCGASTGPHSPPRDRHHKIAT